MCARAFAAGVIVVGLCAASFAQVTGVATDAPATKPATPASPSATDAAAAGPHSLQATITAIEGMVQVRTAEDQPWQRAAVGMVLDENAEFRTGPRSAVRFIIPPDQTVTLDRLGTVKILQAIEDGGRLKTDLGMRYGRRRYDIEAAGREHESTIASPSSTLAVRGTQVILYDQRPFVAEAVSLTGRAEFGDARKKIAFGGPGAGTTKVNTEEEDAASVSLFESFVDPGAALSRSEAEAELVATLISRGSTVDYDYEKGIKVVRGGVPPTDSQLVPTLPGVLNFVLRWTANADVNLAVISPGTEGNRTVYPLGGFDIVASGGTTAFDHRGGDHGGIEVVYWPDSFPDGSYRVGSVHVSGPNTPATVDVFLNGQRVGITTSQGTVSTANYVSQPIDPAFGTGTAVGSVRLFDGQPQGASPAAAPARRNR
jgi:hypothetical protein